MPLHPLTVQIVEVLEVEPPPTITEPLHWILGTTLPVKRVADAQEIVRFYTYRWLVARFHFILKTGGCCFEDSQLRSVEALYCLLGICASVAWRLLWLTYQARVTPEVSCTIALTPTEWQVLYAFYGHDVRPPSTPPSLQQAVYWIAQLGGFVGRRADGQPGVKTLWRGWQRLHDMATVWSLIPSTPDVGND